MNNSLRTIIYNIAATSSSQQQLVANAALNEPELGTVVESLKLLADVDGGDGNASASYGELDASSMLSSDG